MLTESCYSQDKCDHNGDPGDPESFLPVVLSLVGFQAHAALKKTCKEKTYTKNVTGTLLFFFVCVQESHDFLSLCDHIRRPQETYEMIQSIHLLYTRKNICLWEQMFI